MTTAIVIGATGLVGKELVGQLLDDARFEQVVVLVRRATGRTHAKLTEHLVDFNKPESWSQLVKGDAAFSAMGTTRAQAGSVAAQRIVDYDYQYTFAKAAKQNGVPAFALVSSSGANASSLVAYSKMKGELERDITALSFERFYALRPGLLAGEREKSRTGEVFAEAILKGITGLGVLRDWRPIQGAQVARAMVNLVVANGPSRFVAAGECFTVAGT
jgi:uncharacterized protein YbjT (DUF2867 family)